jgi:hypothetical protein
MSVHVAIATGLQRRQQQVTETNSDDQFFLLLFGKGFVV